MLWEGNSYVECKETYDVFEIVYAQLRELIYCLLV